MDLRQLNDHALQFMFRQTLYDQLLGKTEATNEHFCPKQTEMY